MPIFDFVCPKCSYKKEVLVLQNNDIRKYCGKCNELMIRQIGTPYVQFKCRGFPGNDMKRRK